MADPEGEIFTPELEKELKKWHFNPNFWAYGEIKKKLTNLKYFGFSPSDLAIIKTTWLVSKSNMLPTFLEKALLKLEIFSDVADFENIIWKNACDPWVK